MRRSPRKTEISAIRGERARSVEAWGRSRQMARVSAARHGPTKALVNGHSKIEERLARWLLMVHDRVDGDKLHLTHEFLATMLGARRPGVTIALNMLEYRGLIRAKRSEITIVDRAGLIELTGGAYGPEEERHLQAASS